MVIRIFGNMIAILKRKEVLQMAVIYATIIIKGKRTYAQVPTILKPKVKEILTDLDLEELATE